MSDTNVETGLCFANSGLNSRIALQEETVLVVEDEPAILMLAKVMLEELGYRVLTAGTPGEAIRLADKHAHKIQLLITDLSMPEMNGMDLAVWMQTLYPGMKILFMSGYTAEVIIHQGVPEERVDFIQKPFSIQDLAVKVRKAMKSERAQLFIA